MKTDLLMSISRKSCSWLRQISWIFGGSRGAGNFGNTKSNFLSITRCFLGQGLKFHFSVHRLLWVIVSSKRISYSRWVNFGVQSWRLRRLTQICSKYFFQWRVKARQGFTWACIFSFFGICISAASISHAL